MKKVGDARRFPLSPGLRSRPSLSACHVLEPCRMQSLPVSLLSPGLRSRPSLSGFRDDDWEHRIRLRFAVAGTTVPALIERAWRYGNAGRAQMMDVAVAGTTVPALIER